MQGSPKLGGAQGGFDVFHGGKGLQERLARVLAVTRRVVDHARNDALLHHLPAAGDAGVL